jgi:hypothetical protein
MQFWYQRIKQKKYFLGMLIGLIIVIAHLVAVYLTTSSQLNGNEYLFTPYTQWIDFNTGPWTVGLLLGLPLLSALSLSQIVSDDLRNGFFWNILNKQSLLKYLTFEQGLSFIGGALTIVVPLLVDLGGLWCLLPKIKPDLIMNANRSYLPQLTYFYQWYYQHPLMLAFFYILLAGFTAGLFALLASTIALYTNNRFIPLGLGFVLTMILNVMNSAFPNLVFSPVLIIMGLSPVYLPRLTVVSAIYAGSLILLVIAHFIGGYRRASL